MKEFIDKVIGMLEELKTEAFDKWDGGASHRAYSKSIKIINELAEEYNNGWISVKDKLPTETGKYLVTVKNLTGYWILKNNVFVCDYQFDDFIFQGWEDNKVIAWQPLPQPYKEGCE